MTDVRAPKRRMQARYVVAALVCAGIVVWMLTVLQKNTVYMRPVSEAVAKRDDQGDRRFRMGGTVVPGSIETTRDGARFEVTESGSTATVEHRGDPPDLFRDCAPVVVEGHWAGAVFDSDRLLIRHGSEYDASERVTANCRGSDAS